MKQNSKCKKIITIFLVILVLSVAFIGNFNNVYAKVNTLYGDDDFYASQIDVDSAVSDSVVLNAIGYFVYAVAGFVEKIVTWMMGIFTGVEIFPWADKVIFNTVTFLDVNFLNAEPGSLFKNFSGVDTMFGTVIKNIYYTIFVLTVAFFGVVVGIMALKLAISSIASEKAKYKEAITNWLLALILIFTVHYLMSFVFWINEKMVEVATSVAISAIDGNEIDVTVSTSVLSNDEASALTMSALYSAFEAGIGTDEVTETIAIDYGDILLGAKFTLRDAGNDKFAITTKIEYIDFDSYDGEIYAGSDMQWVISENPTFGQIFRRKFAELLLDEEYMSSNYGYTVDYAALANDLNDAIGKIKNSEGLVELVGGVLNYGVSAFKTTAQVIGDMFSGDVEEDMRNVIDHALTLSLLDPELINNLNNDYLNEDIDISNQDYVLNKIKVFTFSQSILLSYYCNVKFNDNVTVIKDPSGNKIYLNDLADVIRNVSVLYFFQPEKFYENNPQLVGYTIDNMDLLTAIHGLNFDKLGDEDYKEVIQKHSLNSASSGTEEIFSGLGEYFKNLVYGRRASGDGFTEYRENKFNAVGAILYAIFVIQSLMYFISYFKRFFYIIVLAMFAPLVVVYDFLNKSIS